MVENLFRDHPPGLHPLHPNPFFIRVIRVIRGSPLVPLRAGRVRAPDILRADGVPAAPLL